MPETAPADAGTADKYDRLLARFQTSGFPPLIIAIGLDDRLLGALERRQSPSHVLAIEPAATFKRDRMSTTTWRSWLASGRLTVLAGPDYPGHTSAWRLVNKKDLQPPMIVDPQLQSEFSAETERAKSIAREIVRGARSNDDARKRFAAGYLLNTLKNLSVIAAEADAGHLTGRFMGVPAIVIGAGPSLDRNLPALRALQHEALLIAVDTAVRPLLAAAIRPHLAVSVDPSDVNGRHLNALPDTRGLWFVAESSLASTVFAQFSGRTFVFKVSQHDPWPWLAEQGCDRGTLSTWGSVLTTAFDLALKAGCDPVVFAGADLAYTRGLQYCRNTAYEPDWSAFRTDTARAAAFEKYLATHPHLEHRDIFGDQATTAPHFIQFRDWIVGHAEAAAPRRIINATAGGILHGGRIEQRQLVELEFPRNPSVERDLRTELARIWLKSTANNGAGRARLQTALAYGASIPLERWRDFAGEPTTTEQIRLTMQASANQLHLGNAKAAYLGRLRDSYNRRIATLEDARALSHGNYDIAARRAHNQQAHFLIDFLQRTSPPAVGIADTLTGLTALPKKVRALDVGCGVGRMMVPLAAAGIRVDGVDLSERMLEYAAANPELADTEFFLSNGADCGAAPDGAYDLVYSQLCFRYVLSRTIRNDLIRAMSRAARPGGVIVVEMRFFPHERVESIPAPHVPWAADAFESTAEAGDAEVRATPGELTLIYDDFSRHLDDVRLQFVDMPAEFRGSLAPHLIVSGSVDGRLWARMNGESVG